MEIKIENLKKIYGDKTVVDIPQLTLGSGELIGLVGNNGAGKTTLMRLILDLIKADDGCVFSNGLQVNETEEWKQYTGSFIDGRFLIDFYTPEEYFTFIGKVYNIPTETVNQRLENYSSLMHDEILGTKKYIRDFSEGNRQKIGIIGAMINISTIQIPVSIENLLKILSGAALPLGLISIGYNLVIKEINSGKKDIILSSFAKFLLLPFFIYFIGKMFELEEVMISILVLFAIMPTAPTSFILARQLNGNLSLMTSIITVQTILAVPILIFYIKYLI